MGEYLGFNQQCLFTRIINLLNVCPSERQKMIYGFNLHSFHYSWKHLLMPHQTLICVCVCACTCDKKPHLQRNEYLASIFDLCRFYILSQPQIMSGSKAFKEPSVRPIQDHFKINSGNFGEKQFLFHPSILEGSFYFQENSY